MAIISITSTSVAVNPLKHSQAVGATLAFMGFAGVMPVLHGSPGCSAFTKTPLANHFREIIPLSTTAMTEVATVLGGEESIRQAILTLVQRHKPEILGLCTTGLTETRGDDMGRFLKEIRSSLPELNNLPIVLVSTPDFKGTLQDGFAAAVETIVKEIPQQKDRRDEKQVTILASSAFTPGDVQSIKEMCFDFGLNPIVLPDLSGLLDVNFDDLNCAVTSSGTNLEQLRSIGNSTFTLALGESMRSSARILQQKFRTPYDVFNELTGLEATDRFLYALAQISGLNVPEKYYRQRRQLQHAMLSTHLYFSCKRVAVALEPDLLWLTIDFLHSMGASIYAAVTTARSPLLDKLPVSSITIGDLEDFEQLAATSDLIIANSHAEVIAKRLNIPLYRQGIPIFDQLGNAYCTKVGYLGTMQQLFDIANLLIKN